MTTRIKSGIGTMSSAWKRAALAVSLAAAFSGAALGADPVPQLQLEVTGFAVEGDNPLGREETQRILAPYAGAHAGIAGLEAAADALEQAIRARGLAFHRVVLPPQTPRDGTVVLRVLRFVLGRVEVKGAAHFSEANVLRSLPALRTGEVPSPDALARSLAIANDNPAKQTLLTMREGTREGTVDAEVSVRDANPRQTFLALNNTGSRQTGHYRTSLGFQHANLFDRDHVLTLSFTTSPDHVADVKQYGAYYAVPFYASGASLALYATYSDVNSGRIADFFQVSGRGTFLGARYTYALPRAGAYTHKAALGIERRHFENDVSFNASPIGTDVASAPVTLRYQGRWERAAGETALHVEHVANLGLGADNDATAYSANRLGARRNWRLWRYGIDLAQVLAPDWVLSARLRAQHAGEPLIAGEQFGLGGAYSVRGFKERETAGDNGTQVSIEVSGPRIGTVQPLVFADWGRRRIENAGAGQAASADVASVGFGARWQWERRLDLQVDVAHVLKGLPTGTASGDQRVHFALVYRF
jgi:hemolysin activation/secretion protein